MENIEHQQQPSSPLLFSDEDIVPFSDEIMDNLVPMSSTSATNVINFENDLSRRASSTDVLLITPSTSAASLNWVGDESERSPSPEFAWITPMHRSSGTTVTRPLTKADYLREILDDEEFYMFSSDEEEDNDDDERNWSGLSADEELREPDASLSPSPATTRSPTPTSQPSTSQPSSAQSQSPASPIPEPDEEMNEIERDMMDETLIAEDETCQICYWRKATSIMDNCRHQPYCGLCVRKVNLLQRRARQPPRCPICRQEGAIITAFAKFTKKNGCTRHEKIEKLWLTKVKKVLNTISNPKLRRRALPLAHIPGFIKQERNPGKRWENARLKSETRSLEKYGQ